MQGLGHDNAVDHRLDAFGHHGLQGLGFNRQSQACQARDMAAIACNANADAPRANASACCLHANHKVAIAHKAGDFAFLNDIDAQTVRAARIAPGNCIMPRGATPAQDARLEAELMADPKERAEHLMLVDLGRNDLGRVCQPGSVAVQELMVIERYSHVMHIVSQVEGVLRADADVWDLLQASFPAGTVSGAPKIRAMQLINELEQGVRGPYSGVYGAIDLSGALNTAITIRTMVVRSNGKGGWRVQVQAGAGIVADSDPSSEYEETLNKARGLLKALACLS